MSGSSLEDRLIIFIIVTLVPACTRGRRFRHRHVSISRLVPSCMIVSGMFSGLGGGGVYCESVT